MSKGKTRRAFGDAENVVYGAIADRIRGRIRELKEESKASGKRAMREYEIVLPSQEGGLNQYSAANVSSAKVLASRIVNARVTGNNPYLIPNNTDLLDTMRDRLGFTSNDEMLWGTREEATSYVAAMAASAIEALAEAWDGGKSATCERTAGMALRGYVWYAKASCVYDRYSAIAEDEGTDIQSVSGTWVGQILPGLDVEDAVRERSVAARRVVDMVGPEELAESWLSFVKGMTTYRLGDTIAEFSKAELVPRMRGIEDRNRLGMIAYDAMSEAFDNLPSEFEYNFGGYEYLSYTDAGELDHDVKAELVSASMRYADELGRIQEMTEGDWEARLFSS